MNSLLCHVRQQISDLQTAMVGGVTALPHPLLPVVHSVQEELVPVSWTHPNGQPNTHSLTSWLDGKLCAHDTDQWSALHPVIDLLAAW